MRLLPCAIANHVTAISQSQGNVGKHIIIKPLHRYSIDTYILIGSFKVQLTLSCQSKSQNIITMSKSKMRVLCMYTNAHDCKPVLTGMVDTGQPWALSIIAFQHSV